MRDAVNAVPSGGAGYSVPKFSHVNPSSKKTTSVKNAPKKATVVSPVGVKWNLKGTQQKVTGGSRGL